MWSVLSHRWAFVQAPPAFHQEGIARVPSCRQLFLVFKEVEKRKGGLYVQVEASWWWRELPGVVALAKGMPLE